MSPELWSIVLAAGEGRRLRSLTGATPKQFWCPPGRPSLLESTLDRMRSTAPRARTVTVIGDGHRPYAEAIDRREALGRVVAQPMDRGTAAGVLLGLSEVPLDPDAIVVLTPSDHGVADERLFHAGIRHAAGEVRAGRTEMVLFTVRPTRASGDYGWVVPGDPPHANSRLVAVRSFVEKPDPARAGALFVAGAAWSTMVLVASARALARSFGEHLPHLVDVFTRASLVETARRWAVLSEGYRKMAPADFSRDVLSRVANLHTYIWPDRIGWTDLGTPDRLQEWLLPIRHDGEPSNLLLFQ